MRRVLLGSTLLVGFAAGCARQGAAPPDQAPPSPRWAYFCFQEGDPEQVNYKANAAGAEGWELVAAGSAHSSAAIWCFRRKRP